MAQIDPVQSLQQREVIGARHRLLIHQGDILGGNDQGGGTARGKKRVPGQNETDEHTGRHEYEGSRTAYLRWVTPGRAFGFWIKSHFASYRDVKLNRHTKPAHGCSQRWHARSMRGIRPGGHRRWTYTAQRGCHLHRV